ncbi:helix-turn-helix transcriptional regulator [Allorhizocola rhizosphaerae]|uniref:helix-turn-helix transcriptional regulator n=1 Tax=Allorhizocola rhizosphaerae TaxID=1872709 RepID=UPI0013C325E4|nr:LuxR C-terminal-related transcriptional regulator [Allorhizocola rhizosphaerae]
MITTGDIISTRARRLYEQLVEGREVSVDEVDRHSEWGEAVRELVAHSLVKLSDEQCRRLVPVSPEAAVASLSLATRQKVLEHQRSLMTMEARLRDLQQRYERVWGGELSQAARLLKGAEEVCQTTISETLQARHTAHALLSPSISGHAECLTQIEQTVQHLSARGVRCQITCDSTLLADHKMDGTLTRLSQSGSHIRVVPSVQMQMWIIDDSQVLTTYTSDDNELSMLIISDTAVVSGLHDAFSKLHTQGIAYAPTAEPGGGVLTPAQRRVLSLMALGHRDTEIAEILGISERTIRRYVSDILDRLGASTRFHAAFIAARRGLLG